MPTLQEELQHYKSFVREVMIEDSGLAVWDKPEFEGIKLLAEAETAEYYDRD